MADIPNTHASLLVRLRDLRDGAAWEEFVAGLLEGYLAHLRQPTTMPAPSLSPTPGVGQIGNPSYERGPSPPRAARWRALGAVATLLLLSLLALSRGAWQQGVAEAPAPRADYPEDFHPALRGNSGEIPGLRIFGPEPSECVRFEPDGLRITLPATYPRQRLGTGVVTDFGVRGDFEITVNYEIIQEPEAGVSGNPTDLRLVAVPNEAPRPGKWHRSNQNRVSLARDVGRWNNAGQFVVDSTRWHNEEVPRDQWGNELLDTLEVRTYKRFPATAKTGQLRLVRGGATLSFYAREEPGQDFSLLYTSEFGTEDLKSVRILGATGGPGASLDVRVTDLRIRAEAFPKGAAAVWRPAAATPMRKWLVIVLALAGLAVALVVSLGAWHYTRTRRRAIHVEQVASADAVRAVAFACPTCGKRLKAKAEQAGSKLKCPRCGKALVVPQDPKELS